MELLDPCVMAWLAEPHLVQRDEDTAESLSGYLLTDLHTHYQ
ncbi:hypothetical protein HaLaN_06289, partial [Haematococcus lacustris]